ncbi:MAG: TIGR04282 family arsenosugar biosynthesis glycosyltransferase [Hyphomicrobiaceae bacterium]
MARVPVAGRVKTRLAREVGLAEATRFYRATLAAVVGRLAADSRWETLVAVAPDSGVASRALPHRVRRIGQGAGDLGHRMQRPMRVLPPGPVCVIGTDIPGIRPADIRRAFRALGGADAVLGPAEDGGFWLVGLRRRPHVLWPYAGVRWSQPDTLAAVMANLENHPVALTACHSDVDTARDLARLGHLVGRRILPLGHADTLPRDAAVHPMVA